MAASDDDAPAAEYKGPWSVALFLVDRQYGGPEEGGWWYEQWDPVPPAEVVTLFVRPNVFADIPLQWFKDLHSARSFCEHFNAGVAKDLNRGRPPISSVNSIGRYRFGVCEGYPAREPAQRPRYE